MADAIDDGLVPSPGPGQAFPRRTWGDILLCGVTLAELSLLVLMTPTFTALDWNYVLQHVLVFGVALTRPPPRAQDSSWRVTMACLVSYAYPYAHILAIGDRLIAVIQDYSAHFRDLSHDKATQLVEDYLAVEADRVRVRRAHVAEFAKSLPGRKVARLYQIENKMDAVLRYDLAATIPVVEESSGVPAR